MFRVFSKFRALPLGKTATATALAVTLTTMSAQGAFVSNGLTGNRAYDGWENLKAGTVTTASLVAGFDSNEVGSGDAILSRTSGAHFPASSSLYSFSTNSTFQVADSTALADVETVVLSILTWPSAGDGSNPTHALSGLPTFNYNGGTQALPADYTGVQFQGAGSLGGIDVDTFAYTFQWDLTSLGSVASFDVHWGQLVHAGVVAVQLEQADTFSVSTATASVPEPTAIALVGLAGCGLLVTRMRRRFAGHANLS